MEYINELYDLCEVISRKIAEANEKIRKAGGELSGGDVEYIDKLTHTLKSLKTTIAMMEAEDDGGYSMAGGSYQGGNRGNMGGNRGGSRANGSYARGRGRNARRDSMGRYSSEGGMRRYSRNGGNEMVMQELERLMQEADDDEIREALREAMDSISMG